MGHIPSHWSIKRLKYLTQVRKELSEHGTEELLSVTETRGIVKRKELRNTDENISRSENLRGYRLVRKGDLVNNIMLVWKRGLGVSQYEGIVSPAYSVFSFKDDCDPNFFNYLLRSDEYISEFRRHSTGITMSRLRLYDDSFGNVFAHLPPIEEQKLISRYLDKKTSQIDLLVEKIHKKIELLKEQRTSLINHYVTKGLDPNVEMKDSGVEWIGEIPNHWKLSKIKYERSKEKYSLVDGPFGSDLKSEHFVDNGDVFVIESGFVTKGSFQQTREFKTISKNHFEKIRRSECFEGDIIIAKIGEYYGMSSILPDLGRETVVSGNSCRLKISSNNNVEFFHSLLLNLRYQGVIQREVNQTGQPFISLGVIDNLYVFVPPLKEQQEIVEHMRETISNIDRVISLTSSKMELLSEYRQSLISNVVTGKINVTEDMV